MSLQLVYFCNQSLTICGLSKTCFIQVQYEKTLYCCIIIYELWEYLQTVNIIYSVISIKSRPFKLVFMYKAYWNKVVAYMNFLVKRVLLCVNLSLQMWRNIQTFKCIVIVLLTPFINNNLWLCSNICNINIYLF